jgi:hypothetical protein
MKMNTLKLIKLTQIEEVVKHFRKEAQAIIPS